MVTHYSFDYHKFTDYALSLCHEPHTIWLDSSDTQHPNGVFSFVVTEPYKIIDARTYTNTHSIFDELKTLTEFQYTQETNDDIPFTGGFVGFIGYDYLVKNCFNVPLPQQKNSDLPDFYGGLYDVVLYADHHNQKAGIIGKSSKTYSITEKIQCILIKANKKRQEACANKFPPIIFDTPDYQTDFERKVTRTIDYIKQGDIFQANITRSIVLEKPANFSSLDLYAHLRTINASPFGAYLDGGDFQIASASPERFLKIINRKIICEPIKGTISRLDDPILDEKQKEHLQNCPKNRAENIMITDLLRNDITPYAKTGSIIVEKLCELQSYKGLHHLVSKITAMMQPQSNIFDVLEFSLPAGSITGAPKKRVCEIIYELEQQQRSAYCGNLGYIGFNGNCDMNILIRTLQIDQKTLTFQAGCGITAQSDPSQEYQETLTKLHKIIETLTGASYVSCD